ncbi:MAG: hypothetical protein ACLVJ6_14355 [Merdibacter sp.]
MWLDDDFCRYADHQCAHCSACRYDRDRLGQYALSRRPFNTAFFAYRAGRLRVKIDGALENEARYFVRSISEN